jgi:hypothetical protein
MEEYKWAWCNICEVATVICPNCGNNCCNRTSPANCCDSCKGAYTYQKKCDENGDTPSREECEMEIGPIQLTYNESETLKEILEYVQIEGYELPVFDDYSTSEVFELMRGIISKLQRLHILHIIQDDMEDGE